MAIPDRPPRSPLRPIALLAALLAAASLGAARAEPTDERPNILFVFADDHASRAISAYGSEINRTPNIDRLAREGMLFQDCYVTNSICGPSRAVILTGRYSHLNGFVRNGNTFDGRQTTFPKLLRRAGYQTAVVGKWHLKSVPTGFDHFDVLIGQGPYYNPPMRTTDAEGNVVVRRHTGYTTDIITDKVLAWLQEDRDPDRPFMLMYQHKAPHRNWLPGPTHLALYDDVEIPEPETFWDDYRGRASPAREQEMTVREHLDEIDLKLIPPGYLTPDQKARWDAAYEPKNRAMREARLTGKELVRWKYQRYIKDYLRCVKSVDDNLGRVLDYLDASGLAQNTVVVYSSDQGWYLGEHGWYDKRWMYEESLTTPLIVRWPGRVEAGSRTDRIVSNLDLAQTFLEIAAVEAPDGMQGRSLVALLEGAPPDDWRKSFYYHYYEFPGYHHVARHYGVTTGRHKLIHYYQKGEWELFDLERDPNELTSVHDQPAYAAVQAQLERELERLRRDYRVPDEDPPASNPQSPR